jgi:hypothetical protein
LVRNDVSDFVKKGKCRLNAVRLLPLAHSALLLMRVRSCPIAILAPSAIAQVDAVLFDYFVLDVFVVHAVTPFSFDKFLNASDEVVFGFDPICISRFAAFNHFDRFFSCLGASYDLAVSDDVVSFHTRSPFNLRFR